MPEKWDLPPTKPPFWLDPEVELLANPEPMPKAEFVLRCVDEIGAALPDATPAQQFQVVANAIVETGWGRHRKGNNLGGWKITKHEAGPGVPWFRARGNKAPGATVDDYKGGDPPWCHYKVFDSFAAYFDRWVARFVPRPGSVPDSHRYAVCGLEFWAGEPWFDDLIKAGYKGENTKAHPWKSIESLNALAREVAVFWAQRAVGATPDGEWGRLSKEAAVARGVTTDGALDGVLAALMPGYKPFQTELRQKAPEKAPEKAAQKAPQKATEKAPEKATEKAPEKAPDVYTA